MAEYIDAEREPVDDTGDGGREPAYIDAEREITRWDWQRFVRRARPDVFSPTTKHIAYELWFRSDKNGRNIYPGVARLSVETGQSWRTVRRALDALRKAGFITRVERGNRRAGQADHYRLSVPDDPLGIVRSPDELDAACKALNDDRRKEEADRQARKRARDQGSPMAPETATIQPSPMAAETADQGPPVTPETAIRGHTKRDSGAMGDPPPAQSTSTYKRPAHDSSGGRASPAHAREDDQERFGSEDRGGSRARASVCERCGLYLEPDGTCRDCRRGAA